MNNKELQGITLHWASDLDKEDYLVYPKNEVVVNKDEVILDVYGTILSFFKYQYLKDIDKVGKATEYTLGIIATLNEMERVYPCVNERKEKLKNNGRVQDGM